MSKLKALTQDFYDEKLNLNNDDILRLSTIITWETIRKNNLGPLKEKLPFALDQLLVAGNYDLLLEQEYDKTTQNLPVNQFFKHFIEASAASFYQNIWHNKKSPVHDHLEKGLPICLILFNLIGTPQCLLFVENDNIHTLDLTPNSIIAKKFPSLK